MRATEPLDSRPAGFLTESGGEAMALITKGRGAVANIAIAGAIILVNRRECRRSFFVSQPPKG